MTRDFLVATRALQRKEVIVKADDERDFESAFQSLVKQGAGALVIASSVFFDTYGKTLASLALQHSIPSIYQRRDFVQDKWRTFQWLSILATRNPMESPRSSEG
jgi:hypothetical protein